MRMTLNKIFDLTELDRVSIDNKGYWDGRLYFWKNKIDGNQVVDVIVEEDNNITKIWFKYGDHIFSGTPYCNL